MRIKDEVVAHAEACRLAWAYGEKKPAWALGSLSGVDLRGANLWLIDLTGADLTGADLTGADLSYADLWGADLRDATLPDGRTLAEWQADPLAGLCDDPKAVARAIAAWGGRTWKNCPLHAALGVTGLSDVSDERRALAATFVALLDGGHLPRPTAETHT